MQRTPKKEKVVKYAYKPPKKVQQPSLSPKKYKDEAKPSQSQKNDKIVKDVQKPPKKVQQLVVKLEKGQVKD